LKAKDRKVYAAVKERSLIDDWPACEFVDESGERCRHNGTRWPLQMAHIVARGQGGETSESNVRNTCLRHHFKNDHGENIVDSQPMF